MKIAIVNLSKLEDISKLKSFKLDMGFLEKNNIDYVDYASGRSTKESLYEGFEKAIKDKEVSLVLFYQGGTTLIKFLDIINWDEIVKYKKQLCGLSDFTHLSVLGVENNVKSYYGFALKNVTKYFGHKKQKEIANFLNSMTQLGIGDGDVQYDCYQSDIQIIGGHLCIMIYMLSNYPIDISERALFIEYHDAPGQDFSNLEYYLDQLSHLISNNPPKEIILGHSILYDENCDEIDFKRINIFMKAKLSDLNIPIRCVDHFDKLIPMS